MIDKITSPLPLQAPNAITQGNMGHEISRAGESFASAIERAMQESNKAQINGDNAIMDLQSGKAEHLHEVMLAVEKADISLRTLVQMRNKALSAYEEIMRMQL